jgi:hypothetical protein
MVLWGHHIAAVLPPFSASLHITAALSRCLQLCLASKTALWCPSKRDYLSRPRLPTPTPNQCEANERAELGIKEARFPAASSSQLTIQADSSRRAVNSKTHQGGNYARLPGHNASWTGHYIAQQSTLAASTQPATAPACHTIHRGLPASLLHTAATIAHGLTLPPHISPRHTTCHRPATQLTDGAATAWTPHRGEALRTHVRAINHNTSHEVRPVWRIIFTTLNN